MDNYDIRAISTLFYGDGGRFFEIIDKTDGLRKPAIVTAKRKDDDTEELWEVTVRRDFLNRWLGGEDE